MKTAPWAVLAEPACRGGREVAGGFTYRTNSLRWMPPIWGVGG